ncbi:MAG: glycosyltransferase family 4 protein, partial [Anaerolineae bacterium]
QLPGIKLLYNHWGLSPNLYSLFAPLLHRRALRQATVFKTNQLDGAWTAVIAGQLLRKPVIVRAGYLWAKNFVRQNGQSLKSRLIKQLEKFSFRRATAVVVTTTTMRQTVSQQYGIDLEKIHVIPNYVDTDTFRPLPEITSKRGRICYVGRLIPLKNLDLLIQAVAAVPGTSLTLVGNGEQQPELERLAQHLGAPVIFAGRISNIELPQLLNQASIFVLPSQYEGHPKALIEAMACGLAVVGSDVEGIRDVIQPEQTGLLVAPTVPELTAALNRLMADEALCDRLGNAAAKFAQDAYSLKHIVELEQLVMRRTVEVYAK